MSKNKDQNFKSCTVGTSVKTVTITHTITSNTNNKKTNNNSSNNNNKGLPKK